MSEQINDKLTSTELIQRFAKINNISIEEAKKLIDAESEEEIIKKIENYTLKKIQEKMPPLNRAQRRAMKKKQGKNKTGSSIETIAETTKKLNYIDLIQKLRALNKQREGEDKNEEIN